MNYNTQEFKDVVGFEGLYVVNQDGVVISVKRVANLGKGKTRVVPAKLLSKWYNFRGYELVSLHKNSKKISIPTHIIVAKAFISNPENKPEVNHKDGDKKNNNVNNLEWVTRIENQRHSIYVLGKHRAGELHHNAKITVEQVVKLRGLYATGLYNMAEAGRMVGINDKDTSARIIQYKSWKTLKKKNNEVSAVANG